ncbi:tetratricopeptide repeat protein [Nocardiopsis aegyptia]|uniref:Tetratricopeptide (TPR) repeat protein n=1 Tax=Nocardiopsis aegyptia TaxID=220378 RepID=A0A7Z0J8A0_9ACTN|nr:tetratricopeptide repeat protein [Nocardiopsis aegyptia]NYJ32883.1 tetratricopeptide (TPR) repeat protein [Nocardiopsis aegyptia]
MDNTIEGDPSGPTAQAGVIHGGVGHTIHHHQAPPATSALFAVPAPPDGFTGRTDQLRELLDRLDPSPADRARVPQGVGAVVSALAGMGGVGKTALALQAAATAAGRGWFCAQLFVDLHSYTPTTPPVEAAAALDVLLRQAGVDPDDIPSGLEERSAFYRSALHALSQADEHCRPVLVVADNAHTLAQVEPLLPGSGGHRLLVTSRERLAVGGHQPLALDTLPEDEAVDLLKARLGSADARCGDAEGLAALAGRCGYLPLALKIAAALLARTPTVEPGRLAQRLAEVSRFSDGRDDLAAVFEASLTHLPQGHVRVFALLGTNPGPDLSTAAAAALTGLGPEEVEAVLEELAAAHLLTAHPGGRWSMHDLLVGHARTLPLPAPGPDDGVGEDTDARHQALVRLLDFYTAVADAADDHLRALPGHTPPELFTDRQQALGRLEAEYDNLINAVQAAYTHGHTTTAIRLPSILGEYLNRCRRFEDAITVHTQAQEAAQQVGDVHGEATAWNNLGSALQQVRRFEEAIHAHHRAHEAFHEAGNTYSQASVWNNLGLALQQMGWFDKAIVAHQHARDTFHQVGDAHGEATAWNSLGLTLTELGRFGEAIDAHRRACDAYHQLGDTFGEAMAWGNLGIALQEVGRFEEAIDAHQRARDTFHQREDVHGEAMAWASLGTALQKTKRTQQAREAFEQAVRGFRDTHDEYRLTTTQRNLDQLRQRRSWWRIWER